MTIDSEYFSARARKERELAARCVQGPARRVHEELAARYTAKARTSEPMAAGERSV
ncbi:hypothetical protein [Sphingomonas pokkalii]|uniref:hypothetical protein n=1 Tax=Sphingomonas pokkalii TaxID=2175090 RepID=UPI001402BFA1|nr:hypothetical protein [Sphingomonas pokkalii]